MLDMNIILQTINDNIETDYEGEYSSLNVKNIVELFRKAFSEKNPKSQRDLYNQIKLKITDKSEKQIIDWIQTKRSFKYSGESFPECRITIGKRTIELCPTTAKLNQSRPGHSYVDVKYAKEQASLSQVKIGKSEYFLNQVQIKKNLNLTKTYLFRQKSNSKPIKTPWVVEKTKDLRYVWRGDIKLDRQNVAYLLKFILTKRQKWDPCPSILINAGSHGAEAGENAHSSGNWQLAEGRIYDEMVDLIAQLLDDKTLKLNQENIYFKIYIHKVSECIPCAYPLLADHIIDVQCSGAYEKVEKELLVPKKVNHQEVDLMFLDGATTYQQIVLNSGNSSTLNEPKKLLNDSFQQKGDQFFKKGMLMQALENYNKSLAIKTKIFGTESAEVTQSLATIGNLCLKKGNSKVMELQEELNVKLTDVFQQKQQHDIIREKYFNQSTIFQEVEAQTNQKEFHTKALADAAGKLAAECAEALQNAEPPLRKAEEALKSIQRKEIQVLRSFANPPSSIILTSRVVLTLLKEKISEKDSDERVWQIAKGLLKEPEKFVERLLKLDFTQIDQNTLDFVDEIIDDPSKKYTVEYVQSRSIAASKLCGWSINIVNFYKMFKKLRPVLLARDMANENLEIDLKELTKAKEEVRQRTQMIEKLKKQWKKAEQLKKIVEEDAAKCENKLKSIKKLVNDFASENNKWLDKKGTNGIPSASEFIVCIDSFTAKLRSEV